MPKGKILTIDDDPFYASLYHDIFSAKGFDIKHALNAADGYELIKVFGPDLVTLDIMMPEKDCMMDGYGLLKEVRCITGCERLPIIMISALSESGDIKHAAELGATNYIPKTSLTPQLLLNEVNRLLGLH